MFSAADNYIHGRIAEERDKRGCTSDPDRKRHHGREIQRLATHLPLREAHEERLREIREAQ